MPIYEYRCNQCRRKSTIFVPSISTVFEPVCSHCGSSDVRRLISSFAFLRSEEDRLEQLADPSNFADLDENDPRSVARWARRFGKALGEDLGPEFDEMVDRLEAGEVPEELGGESDENGGEDGGEDLDF